MRISDWSSDVCSSDLKTGRCRVRIDVSNGPAGLVVDGQQRLSALTQMNGTDFQVFVSAVVCADDAELRRQFVLINNTSPLPKSLIYELFPPVSGSPRCLSDLFRAVELLPQPNKTLDP